MKIELEITGQDRHLIVARADALAHPDAFAAGLARVSRWRREKAMGYRFEKDRRLSLLAGLLLDELLIEHDLSERVMEYREGEFGKPEFANRDGLHFSLAHSGDLAAAVLSLRPVGVDVERLSDFPADIAEPYRWTTMESVGKLLGCGVGVFVDGRDFAIPPGVQVEHHLLDDHLLALAYR